ncbi:hypothetical protein HDU81_006430 [Chytriomyces hyalinus]|nr:hypothetical protein HDU81_006430 [Chytriomyces hyalinus]
MPNMMAAVAESYTVDTLGDSATLAQVTRRAEKQGLPTVVPGGPTLGLMAGADEVRRQSTGGGVAGGGILSEDRAAHGVEQPSLDPTPQLHQSEDGDVDDTLEEADTIIPVVNAGLPPPPSANTLLLHDNTTHTQHTPPQQQESILINDNPAVYSDHHHPHAFLSFSDNTSSAENMIPKILVPSDENTPAQSVESTPAPPEIRLLAKPSITLSNANLHENGKTAAAGLLAPPDGLEIDDDEEVSDISDDDMGAASSTNDNIAASQDEEEEEEESEEESSDEDDDSMSLGDLGADDEILPTDDSETVLYKQCLRDAKLETKELQNCVDSAAK